MTPIKTYKGLLVSSLFLFLGITLCSAQGYYGLLTENYGGVNSVVRNPAYIADSRFVFDLNLAGASAIFGNDIYSTESISDLFDDAIDIPDDLPADYKSDNFAYTNVDILGPSLLVKINQKSSVALYTRARLIGNLEGNGEDIEQFLNDFNVETDNFVIDQPNSTGSAHGWGEIGLSYARVIKDMGKHFLKGGITLKYLVGIGRGYTNANNLDINYIANGSDFIENLSNGNINLSGDFNYGASVLEYEDFESDDLELPRSFGADLGLVYEYRPNFEDYYITNKDGEKVLDPIKNKYKLRVGLSVTDIGSITYDEGEEGSAIINTTTLNFIGDLNAANDFAAVQGVLNDPAYSDLIANSGDTQEFGELVTNLQNATTIGEVDVLLQDNSDEITTILEDFDNLSTVNSLLNSYNLLTSDTRTGIKASLPTALHVDADWSFNKNLFLNLGANIALTSPTNTKTNSIGNELSLTPRYESRIFSVYSPVRYFQGVGALWGLGMRLGPLYLGSGSLFTALLSSEIQGADAYAGLKVPILNPRSKDTDGDGIKDRKDSCPDDPGPKENLGCPWPDADFDTVVDKDDKCPDTPGDPDNEGCPWPDTDEDGVLDKDDGCPEEKGPEENDGCPWPDSDNDGVADRDDQCPNEVGTVANKGCPEPPEAAPVVTEEVQQELNTFARSILFNSGKSSIKAESTQVLKEITQILKDYPNARFSIEGHTDSIGTYEHNQKLSEQRAAAVERFLITNGIDPSRLTSVGYGERKPIATNMYWPGRKKNRRVEINLIKE